LGRYTLHIHLLFTTTVAKIAKQSYIQYTTSKQLENENNFVSSYRPIRTTFIHTSRVFLCRLYRVRKSILPKIFAFSANRNIIDRRYRLQIGLLTYLLTHFYVSYPDVSSVCKQSAPLVSPAARIWNLRARLLPEIVSYVLDICLRDRRPL